VIAPTGFTVDTRLAPGFWVTLLGLALVALGSAFGATCPRDAGVSAPDPAAADAG
jgi:hypothetical protein